MKPIHKAMGINNIGNVTALCFVRSRAIDLSRATWTNRDEAVTCAKCLKLMPDWATKRRTVGNSAVTNEDTK